jgi:hypothetical protein
MHPAGLDGQVDALEDLVALDRDVEPVDFEQGGAHGAIVLALPP